MGNVRYDANFRLMTVVRTNLSLILALCGLFMPAEGWAQHPCGPEDVYIDPLYPPPGTGIYEKPFFIPPHISGDADFYNRIDVFIEIQLKINEAKTELQAQIFMSANEYRGGPGTFASGRSDWHTVYVAPKVCRIEWMEALDGERFSWATEAFDLRFHRSCCRPRKIPGHSWSRGMKWGDSWGSYRSGGTFGYYGEPTELYFIDDLVVFADRDGSEAGTWTGVSVTFRSVEIMLSRSE